MLDHVISWLNDFGEGEQGWECFVDTFLFQDWVNTDESNPDIYYDVLPLFKGHSWENALVSLCDLEEFFENYQNRIYTRGKRIIEKLNKNCCLYASKN